MDSLDHQVLNGQADFSRRKLSLYQLLLAHFPHILLSVVLLILMYLGQYRNIGLILMSVTGLALLGFVFKSNYRLENLVAQIISLIPFIAIYRQYYFSYHGVTVLLIALCILVVLTAGQRSPLKSTRYNVLLAIFALFYLGSFLYTGKYTTNLRLLECIVAAGLALYLYQNTDIFKHTLGNFLISAVFLSIGFINQIESRFILEILDDPEFGALKLGNPIAMGLPLALAIILVVVDKGRWLSLESNRVLRIGLFILCAALLFISTSRGATLVAITAVSIYLLMRRNNIVNALFYGLLIYLSIGLTQRLGYDLIASNYFKKALSSEQDLSSRTTGRYDQYVVTLDAMKDKPIFGHGFGQGRYVYAEYSLNNPLVNYNRAGKAYVLHSLYLQLIVEGGIIFFLPFILAMIGLVGRNYKNYKLTGMALPLACSIGYLLIIVSVTGNDAISGLFLGISLLDTKNPV